MHQVHWEKGVVREKGRQLPTRGSHFSKWFSYAQDTQKKGFAKKNPPFFMIKLIFLNKPLFYPGQPTNCTIQTRQINGMMFYYI